jgi:type II secretory pathway pseudopilin PulG
MKPLRLFLACFVSGACLASTTLAYAETTEIMLAAKDFMAQSGASQSQASPGHTLEWDPRKGRWGLKLGVDPRTDRETQLRDLAPGVFYKLSPRLHIGGDITLAPDNFTGNGGPRLMDPQAPNPRVRLETTFKF